MQTKYTTTRHWFKHNISFSFWLCFTKVDLFTFLFLKMWKWKDWVLIKSAVWKFIVQNENQKLREQVVFTLPDGSFSHGASPSQCRQTRMLTRMFSWMMTIQQMSIRIRMPSIPIRHVYTNGTSSRITTFRGHIKQTVEKRLLLFLVEGLIEHMI